MITEDIFYPLLKHYLAAPQWCKSSIGAAYRFAAPWLRGKQYGFFLNEAEQTGVTVLHDLRRAKLARTLCCAVTSVPAYSQYRRLLSECCDPDQAITHFPLLCKDDIRRDLSSFLACDAPPRSRLQTFTGGSTSTPMQFYLHKGVTRIKEYAFMESFHRRAGLSSKDVVLALRGRNVATAQAPGGKLWMYEPIKRQLVLSSDHLDVSRMDEYLEAMRVWRPTYIQAYPSAIYPLARWLSDHPAEEITSRFKGIMLYSENILDYQMALLRRVFSCPVYKHYGQSERLLMGASMGDDDRYFFWPQYGHLELVDSAGKPVTQPGVLGEIVGTAFDNEVMPFIRYRTGDLAVLGSEHHPLLPGYPVVERIEGRVQEFIVCRDHRLISITSLSAAHDGILATSGIQTMQFEQETPGRMVMKVVTNRPLADGARQRIELALEKKMQGGCKVNVIVVGEIPRTARGKHKMLVQRLDTRAFFTAEPPGSRTHDVQRECNL